MSKRTTFIASLLWAVLVVVVVHFALFPGSVPDFQRASSGGVLLDASPEFTADGVYDRLAGYGDQGRKNYSFRNLTVDVFLPLSVLPFLFLLMRRAVARVAPGRTLVLVLLAVPLVYVMFDFLENSIVLVLLRCYPERVNLLAVSLPYATIVKRIASVVAIVVPLGLLGVSSIQRTRTVAR